MIAILLAAGYATRLYPLTKDKPKSLLPLGSRLIIDYIMDSVDKIPGLTKVALITNSKFYPHFSEWADSQNRDGKAPIVVLDDGTTDDSNKRGAIAYSQATTSSHTASSICTISLRLRMLPL